MSVVGYSVVRVLVVLGAAGVVVGLYRLGTLVGSARFGLGLGAFGALVAVPVAGAVSYASHAAYYHRRVAARAFDGGAARAGAAADDATNVGSAETSATREPGASSDADPLR